MPLPYLTASFPGTGGTIKNRPEDFFVQEVPLYEPTGEGEHVYCEVQKVGRTTFEAVDALAKVLRVATRDIGYAGLKDAQAVTQQVFSIPGVNEEQVMAAVLPDGMTVQWATRHGNKLRLGHLAGNRFAVKIRDVNPTDVVKLVRPLAELERRGMPNYFGDQRFGRRGDNDRLGAALVRGDYPGLLKLLLGAPDPRVDDAATQAARTLFDAGDLDGSMKAWPHWARMELKVLARYIKTGSVEAALQSVEERIWRLWVSALQSRMFNDVVARRVEALDKLVDGDLSWKHDNGSVFAVPSAAVEQLRCDAFEISPSGPLVGSRMTEPAGEPAAVEAAVLAAEGLTPDDFRRNNPFASKGARRPLRVKLVDTRLEGGVDDHGPHVTVAFTLPPGSFATVLIRELTKSEPPAP
jgi:tRNA pseudouridine13 synthase